MVNPRRPQRRHRAMALVAVASVTAVAALSGCSQESSADDTTLMWYINPDDGGQAEIAAQCSAESNGRYTIQTSLLPRDAASQREQLARRLAAGDTNMDIMSLDPPYVPELAEPGFLAPVPEHLASASTQDTVEGAVAAATWKDELVAVPFWANTQLLWYRTSVAEEAGLDMDQPVTWDQLMDAARETDKELGVHGVRAESMTVWVNALYESQGQSILENPEADGDDLSLGMDSPAGEKTAEIVGTIGREGLGGPGITTQDENIAMENFRGDNGSFMVNWPFVYPATQAAVDQGVVDQEVLDDIAWTTYPRVNPEDPAAPPFGGIALGVGATSEKVDLAYEAVECIVSPENQAYYFVSNGNPPASTAAYDDPEVQEAFPMAPEIRDSLENAAPRPQTPYYNEISTAVQQRWTPLDEVTSDTPRETQEFVEAVLSGEALL